MEPVASPTMVPAVWSYCPRAFKATAPPVTSKESIEMMSPLTTAEAL
jgi:hypothetical protein